MGSGIVLMRIHAMSNHDPNHIQWQPISTAPRDGTEILIYATIGNVLPRNNVMSVGRYDRGWWNNSRPSATLENATHWMPIPSPSHNSEPPNALRIGSEEEE